MSAELVSWAIAVEVALPFVVLSIILIFALIGGKKKNKQAIRNLILKVKENEERQKESLMLYLTEKIMVEEKIAKSKTKEIINERKFLFRNLISGILDKNRDALVGLEDDLSRITDHYHRMDIAAPQPEPESEEELEEKENIKELKQEVKMLKHEVHVTLTTLNNIFGEFSSMFGEEVPDVEMSVDQIITAMENFTNKSAEVDEQGESEADVETETLVEEPDVSDIEELEEDDEIDIEEDSEDDESDDEEEAEKQTETEDADDDLDFSIDSELDDIDSALDELELGQSPDDDEDDEPSWGDAFEESGDTMEEDIEKDN